MNPSKNPAVAQAARLKEIYSKPYVPRSVLAKAIAKPTVRRRVVYGGVDLENLEALTDDDETIEGVSHRRSRSSSSGEKDAKKRRRRRSSRGDTGLSRFKKTSWSVGALETTYVLLVILRALCAVLDAIRSLTPGSVVKTMRPIVCQGLKRMTLGGGVS